MRGPCAGRYGYYGVYAEQNPSGPLVPTAVSLAMRASSELCRHEIAECQKTPDRTPSPDLLAALARYNATAAPGVSLLPGAPDEPAAVCRSGVRCVRPCVVRAWTSLLGRGGGEQEGRTAEASSRTLATPPLSFAPSRRCRTKRNAAHGPMQV